MSKFYVSIDSICRFKAHSALIQLARHLLHSVLELVQLQRPDRARQNKHKLFATESACYIFFSAHPLKNIIKFEQHRIACIVTKGVIEPFKRREIRTLKINRPQKIREKIMNALTYLFWICLCLVSSTYIGYGLVITIAVRLKQLGEKAEPEIQTITPEAYKPIVPLLVAA